MRKHSNYFLYGILSISALFLIVYLFSPCFRNFLSVSNIDPNFLVAFISTIGLFTSIISIKKERKFNFNLNLKNSIEDKVALVVGKLFTVMNNAEAYYKTILNIKHSIDNNKRFVDSNNILNLNEDFLKDRHLLGAYFTIYFSGYISSQDWNSLNKKIGILGTNCCSVLINYNEHFDSINAPSFYNEALSNIETILQNSEKLNKEIYELTEKMKDSLLNIVSENDKNIRDKYIN